MKSAVRSFNLKSCLIHSVMILLGVASCSQSFTAAQSQVPQTQTAEGDIYKGWPRQTEIDGRQITLYQPQVEKWEGNKLRQRAVVSIQTSSSPKPLYGVIWIESRTNVDKANRLVNLENIRITKINFPSAPEKSAEYFPLLRTQIPKTLTAQSLDRLQAGLAVSQAETLRVAPHLKNTPPKIIYSDSPSVLVLVDGNPILRETGTENILRVVNTRSLLLFDQVSGKYFLFLGDRWITAPKESGPWEPATKIKPELAGRLQAAKTKASESRQVDLLNQPDSALMHELAGGNVPKVYVSMGPAELIQTKGKPQLSPISDTALTYVANSPDTIFLNTTDQNYYVLLSGRWYRSKSLQGSWSYVASSQLPPAFSKIPESHPKGDALASVSGTPQAKEAAISNDIPQTATIRRDAVGQPVTYDGSPRFKPINGTPLMYAVNTATPVIRVSPRLYYSVQNGIWFVATGPRGPWKVATKVPSVIYTIPSNSPLYYVTYVYIYDVTTDLVYEGYLPGYLGSYVNDDGTVVFGTGYYYPPWVGTTWVGYPFTFGFGVSWTFGYGWGFPYYYGYYGGYFPGYCVYPWWGPYQAVPVSVPPPPGPPPPPAPPTQVVVQQTHVNTYNVYQTWSPTVVTTVQPRPEIVQTTNWVPSSQANNVYSGPRGNVYRYGNQNWQRYGTQGWQTVTPPSRGTYTGPGEIPPPRRPAQEIPTQRGPTHEFPAPRGPAREFPASRGPTREYPPQGVPNREMPTGPVPGRHGTPSSPTYNPMPQLQREQSARIEGERRFDQMSRPPAMTAQPVTRPPVGAPPVTGPVTGAPPITAPVTRPMTGAPPVGAPMTGPPAGAPPAAAPPVAAPPVSRPPVSGPPMGGPPGGGAPPMGAPPVAAPPVSHPAVPSGGGFPGGGPGGPSGGFHHGH